MDISLYSAMSAAKQYEQMLAVTNANLANAGTSGFKADQISFKSLYLNAKDGLGTVAYPELSGIGIDFTQGSLNHTNSRNDLVSMGDSFFRLTSVDGEAFFSKSVSLIVDKNGVLVNGSGDFVTDSSGGLITVGTRAFDVTAKGDVVSIGGSNIEVIATLGTSSLNNSNALKSTTGRIIASQDNPPVISANSSILVGYREASNVSSIGEMTAMMELQRSYELSAKMMKSSRTLSSNSNKLIGQ